MAAARPATIGSSMLAVAVFAVVNSPGWERVQATFFDFEVFGERFPQVLHAFRVNIQLFLASQGLILIGGLILAVLRSLPGPVFFPVRAAAVIYIDAFRGLPSILVIYLIGFGIPGLGLPRPWNSPYIWGSLALILVYAAYVAEVIRSGIDSIHQSQRSAAASLGLSEADTMRYVILP